MSYGAFCAQKLERKFTVVLVEVDLKNGGLQLKATPVTRPTNGHALRALLFWQVSINLRPTFTKNATWASAFQLFCSRTIIFLYYLFNCYNCPLIMCILVFYQYLFYSVMDQFRRIHHHWFIDIAHVTTILNSYTWIMCTAILIIIIVIKLYLMLSLQNKVILYFS